MSLRDRLESLNIGRRSGAEPAAPPLFPTDRGAYPFVRNPWLDRFTGPLGGLREAGPAGEYHVVRNRHSSDEPHGTYRLGEFLGLTPTNLVWLGNDPLLGDVPLDQVVFFDCETTGLAGGTGTKAFLVGLAYFERQPDSGLATDVPGLGGERLSLVVEQHFLPDYDAEPSFLAGLGATLDRFSWLVSFNGKSFDVPLLETRFILGRQRADWLDYPHLDLLHPSRRVWRRRLESCSLSALESETLGVARQGDVPGWLIPTLYFNFLQSGRFEPLEPVFYHNQQDLLSLVSLSVRLARLVGGDEEPEYPIDWYSVGRLLEDRGQTERGMTAYERALSGGLAAAEREEVRFRLGRLYRRLRRDDDAMATWRDIADEVGDRSIVALVELAKHHEHRSHDLGRAAEATRRALVGLALHRGADLGADITSAALERRLHRLETKLARQRQET
jgi:hypothetical protein